MRTSFLCLLLAGSIIVGCNKKDNTIDNNSKLWIRCLTLNDRTLFRCMAYNKYTNSLLAGTDTGVMVSSDYGLTWQYRNTGLGLYIGISAITVIGNRLVASNSGGIFYSDDDGILWHQSNNGPVNMGKFQYDQNKKRLYAASNTSGLYYSDDNAITWNRCQGITYGPILGLFISDNLIICENLIPEFVRPSNWIMYSTVKRSVDYGTSFITVDSIGLMGIIAFNSVMFGSTDNTFLYKSKDLGLTWKLDSTLKIKGLGQIYSINPGYIFLGGLEDSIYFSRNQGVSWTNITDNFQGIASCFLQVGDILYVTSWHSLWKRNWVKL